MKSKRINEETQIDLDNKLLISVSLFGEGMVDFKGRQRILKEVEDLLKQGANPLQVDHKGRPLTRRLNQTRDQALVKILEQAIYNMSTPARNSTSQIAGELNPAHARESLKEASVRKREGIPSPTSTSPTGSPPAKRKMVAEMTKDELLDAVIDTLQGIKDGTAKANGDTLLAMNTKIKTCNAKFGTSISVDITDNESRNDASVTVAFPLEKDASVHKAQKTIIAGIKDDKQRSSFIDTLKSQKDVPEEVPRFGK